MAKSTGLPQSPPSRSCHFFKVFLPNLSSSQLRIPPAFHPHVISQVPARFYLRGPSEHAWGVELVRRPDGLFFTDGWEAFTYDHSLAAGDFLLFAYNGNSMFSVLIFDKTACEKTGAFSAIPTCDDKDLVGINQSVKRKVSLQDLNNDYCESGMKRMLAQPSQALNSDNLVSQSIDSNGLELARSSSNVFNKAIECSDDANLKCLNQTKHRPRKLLPRGFISQRRPITQLERDDTLAKAHNFKSNNPFLAMVMKGSYVYHGFYLSLPGSFPFEYLPDYNQELILHDPNKKKWSVNYIFSKRPAISGGWAKFAVGNNLELDDVCIFELVGENHIKVHIFRVLDDVKPLLRAAQVMNFNINGVE